MKKMILTYTVICLMVIGGSAFGLVSILGNEKPEKPENQNNLTNSQKFELQNIAENIEHYISNTSDTCVIECPSSSLPGSQIDWEVK